MEQRKEKRDFQWEVLVAVMLMIGTILGVTIPLHLSLQEDVRAIQKEMIDFHGRLEKQDAEFKAHMMYEHDHEHKNN